MFYVRKTTAPWYAAGSNAYDDLGITLKASGQVAGEDQIHAGAYPVTCYVISIPDRLPTQRGRTINQVPTNIRDLYFAVPDQPGNRDRSGVGR